MALVTCGECGREISSQAATCPGCGAPRAHQADAGHANSIWSKKVGCGGVIAVLFVGLIILAMLTPDIDHPRDSSPGSQSISAALACEEFVTRRLKAPSTADFPRDERNITYERPSDSYLVLAAVDSENGFGAKIRTRYSCRVKPDGDQFRLMDIQIHE